MHKSATNKDCTTVQVYPTHQQPLANKLIQDELSHRLASAECGFQRCRGNCEHGKCRGRRSTTGRSLSHAPVHAVTVTLVLHITSTPAVFPPWCGASS